MPNRTMMSHDRSTAANSMCTKLHSRQITQRTQAPAASRKQQRCAKQMAGHDDGSNVCVKLPPTGLVQRQMLRLSCVHVSGLRCSDAAC